jgi:hypothetical protein
MNNEKARELFSAYYEDVLDGSLRQVVAQRLESDPEMRSDYAAFEQTMLELDDCRHEAIDVPISLRSRIADRVDSVAAKPKHVLVLSSWLKGIAFAGVAAAALGVAFMISQRGGDSGRVAMGGLAGGTTAPNTDQLDLDLKDGQVVMSYRPTSPKSVIVSSGASGAEIKRFNLDGKTLQSPLTNDQAGTALLAIEVSGENGRSLVAVPGTRRSASRSGSGTVVQLGVALASYYHVPVLMRVSDESLPTVWDFQTLDARQAATTAVAGQTLSVDQKASGLLVIRSN